jgi:hypothetical protein
MPALIWIIFYHFVVRWIRSRRRLAKIASRKLQTVWWKTTEKMAIQLIGTITGKSNIVHKEVEEKENFTVYQ